MQKFTILGAGFLGMSLANELKKYYSVILSASNNEKVKKIKQKKFETYIFNEYDLSNLSKLLNTDYLFINYPPSKFENYLDFLSKIYSSEEFKSIKKVFFVSSTSIYPNESGLFNEGFEIKKSISKRVFDAENLIKEKSHIIFRCSGLMGDTRIAGKYFSGKSIDTEDKKVNHVHKKDVINATLFCIENDINGIFNLCAPFHPTCKELYLSNSFKYGFEAPIFENKKEYKNRIIDGSKIESLGFEYEYSNPMQFD